MVIEFSGVQNLCKVCQRIDQFSTDLGVSTDRDHWF
jgi:hypothetical protein